MSKVPPRTKRGKDAAAEWARANGYDLDPVVTPLRRSEQADVENIEPAEVAPLKRRLNKSGAPPDYDPEIGMIAPWLSPPREPSEAELARASELATRIYDIIRWGTWYASAGVVKPHARFVTPPPPPKAARLLVPHLAALEALDRALRPGWRGIVADWLTEWANYRLSMDYRELWARESDQGKAPRRGRHVAKARVNSYDLQPPPSGAELVAIMSSNPPEYRLPEGLTAGMLDREAERARKAGRRLSVEKAVARLEREATRKRR